MTDTQSTVQTRTIPYSIDEVTMKGVVFAADTA